MAMAEINRCPGCGAEVRRNAYPFSSAKVPASEWLCGTREQWKDGVCVGVIESEQCLRNQLATVTANYDEKCDQLNTVHAHVKEALELLGVDVSVDGYVPDSWTLVEQCKIAGDRLANVTAKCDFVQSEFDKLLRSMFRIRALAMGRETCDARAVMDEFHRVAGFYNEPISQPQGGEREN